MRAAQVQFTVPEVAAAQVCDTGQADWSEEYLEVMKRMLASSRN